MFSDLSFFFPYYCYQVGKDVPQICGSSFLSLFGTRSLSSQFDAIVIMSSDMARGMFERIAFYLSRFKLLTLASFLWLRRLNLIASPNKIDWIVEFG